MPTTVTDLAEQIYEAALYECRQALPGIEQFEPEYETVNGSRKVSRDVHEYAYEQYLGLIDFCMLVQDFKDWLDDDPSEKFIEPEVEPIRKAIEVCKSDCIALMETW